MSITMPKKATQETNPKANSGTPSTQKYLDISEFRNDIVVMKDGTLRGVLMVSSMNFFLKSEDEQNAIIQGYRQFLNAIDFPMQILVQSRRFDISKYIARLDEMEKKQTNDLLKLQIADYRQFIGELVEMGNIMDKKFFVVVPYDPLSDSKRGFFHQIKEVFSAAGEIRLRQDAFARRRHVLDQRLNTVAAGLRSMGLNVQMLDTQALIELFYIAYNPDTSPHEKLSDLEQLQVEE